MAGELVDLKKQGAVGTISLNRPEARNALNPEILEDLGSAIQKCRDPGMRAVIITGSGGYFCAGADVKDFVNQMENGGPQAMHPH